MFTTEYHHQQLRRDSQTPAWQNEFEILNKKGWHVDRSRLSNESRRLARIVKTINDLEPYFVKMNDEELRGQTGYFRRRFQDRTRDQSKRITVLYEQVEKENDPLKRSRLEAEIIHHKKKVIQNEQSTLDEILPEVFAAVREAARRAIGQRHFDVQLLAGIILHEGKIAEMKTGEGKTLVATLPLYLNAIAGHGVHLVTPNDYLSRVGAGWMGSVYERLGMSTAVIAHEFAGIYDPHFFSPEPHADDRLNHFRPVSRRDAYAADILYGTNNEFGFDYLRDNMVVDHSQTVQRPFHFAIVDEVDNILIDEARTPLIISGPAEEPSREYSRFASLLPNLQEGIDFTVNKRLKVVIPTEEGIAKIESLLQVPEGKSLYDPEYLELLSFFENTLEAHALYRKDHEYIVEDGQVVIIDEFTGRRMYGRRYSDGLHQALEAKEGVKVQRESLTFATVTFQNYFRMYPKLAGMTGTARTEQEEFHKIYGLEVLVVPTNRPTIREDREDVVLKNEQAKFKAVVDAIKGLHAKGRPVLIGTTSIENSERLAELLLQASIPRQVLNAKEHEQEALVIVQAGRPGAVTVATNMAGRGVDILLGGDAEGLTRELLRKGGIDLSKPVDSQTWGDAFTPIRATCEADRQKVVRLGGLHVIGTERHEARRIDNQLRGRAGRQGDPGSSQFFVSLDDTVMKRMGGNQRLLNKVWDDTMTIESPWVSKMIGQAQVKMEGYNFDLRKHLLEYDDVINKHREVIYGDRRRAMVRNLRPQIQGWIRDEIAQLVKAASANNRKKGVNYAALSTTLVRLLPLANPNDLPSILRDVNPKLLTEFLSDIAQQLYHEKLELLGDEKMALLERIVVLNRIDAHWVAHLTHLEELRTGIGLRAVGHQDPLVTFKREAHPMFRQLQSAIKRDIVYMIYQAQIQSRNA
ncbi:preprotein translocase subunit SecA [Candidatus Roizmanbacteria bacterium]|nr:preprotein translocase subunit SecA [Candidatus Roizmanbacteria bacterium]